MKKLFAVVVMVCCGGLAAVAQFDTNAPHGRTLTNSTDGGGIGYSGYFYGDGHGLTNGYASNFFNLNSGPLPTGLLTGGTTNGGGHLLVVNNGKRYNTFDASALTNLNQFQVTPAGQPQDVNMGNLWRFYSTLTLSNRPVRIVSVTDLSGFPGGSLWNKGLRGVLGNAGGIISGNADDGDLLSSADSKVVQVPSTTDMSFYLFTWNYFQLTNTATLGFSRASGSGTGIADTNFFADTLEVRFLAQTNGGNFNIQTNIAGGGWGTLKTVSGLYNGTNYATTNFSVTPGYYSLRVVGSTATNLIIGGGLYNSAMSRGLLPTVLGLNGQSLRDITGAKTNLSWPFWSSLNPDLILVLDTDGVSTPSSFAAFNFMITNACPNADVVYVGNHLIDGQNTAAYNYQMRTNAIQYGRAFWDTAGHLNNASTQVLTNYGMMLADGVHLTTAGVNFLSSGLLQSLTAPFAGFAGPWHNDSSLTNSTENNLFNSGNTNWVGIGTTKPKSVLDINMIGESAPLNLGFSGTSPAIWFNNHPELPNDYAISGSANGTVINAPTDGAGWGIQFNFGGGSGNKMTLWPSGGLDISAFGAINPGAGGLLVSGLVTFVNSNAAPADATTPKSWMYVTNSGQRFSMPLYK
jgi:hypothetical protein